MTTNNLIEEIVEEFEKRFVKTLKWEQGELQAFVFEKNNNEVKDFLSTALTKLQRDTVLVVMPEEHMLEVDQTFSGEITEIRYDWNSCREAMLAKARELNIEI